jgi:hypothetical protein
MTTPSRHPHHCTVCKNKACVFLPQNIPHQTFGIGLTLAVQEETEMKGCPLFNHTNAYETLENLKKRCNDEIYSLVVGEQSRNTGQSETLRNAISAGLHRAVGYIDQCLVIADGLLEEQIKS